MSARSHAPLQCAPAPTSSIAATAFTCLASWSSHAPMQPSSSVSTPSKCVPESMPSRNSMLRRSRRRSFSLISSCARFVMDAHAARSMTSCSSSCCKRWASSRRCCEQRQEAGCQGMLVWVGLCVRAAQE